MRGRKKGTTYSQLDKKIEEYEQLIERLYPGIYKYIKTERTEVNPKKYRYHVTVQCLRCGIVKTATIESFKIGNKCRCSEGTTLRVSAKNYAQELYRDLNTERLGMPMGKDLDMFIRASAEYDRATLYVLDGYVDMVIEFMDEIYEKEEITRCKCCGIWLPKKNLHRYKKDYCKDCYKDLRRQKKIEINKKKEEDRRRIERNKRR